MTREFDIDAMRMRLEAALKAKGLSKRAVSLSSGHAAGYVHSILSEGKEPTVGSLAAVCDAAGLSLSFVMYGIDVTPETEALLLRIQANPEKRDSILDLLGP